MKEIVREIFVTPHGAVVGEIKPPLGKAGLEAVHAAPFTLLVHSEKVSDVTETLPNPPLTLPPMDEPRHDTVMNPEVTTVLMLEA